jgi:hypothetical protein
MKLPSRVMKGHYNLWSQSIARSPQTKRELDHIGGPKKNDKAANRRPVSDPVICPGRKSGAGEGARTLDPDLGKVVLYH